MSTPSNPSSSSSSSSSSFSYDLTSLISPFLDRHLIIPLIEYLEEKLLYPSEQLLLSKYSIAEKTKMVDYAYGFYKQLYNKEPEEAEDKRKKVYGELKQGEEACGPLIDLLKDFEKVAELRKTSNFTLAYLMEHEKVTESHLEALWCYARLCFDIGRYRDSADYLSVFRLLCPDLSDPRKFSAQWGKLAAEILMTNWDTAYNDLLSLKESIDNRVFVSHTEQLQQRTWLLHWSLFIFFKIEDGRTLFIEFLLNDEKLLNVISSAAPHILRYLSAAVIMHRRRTKTLQEVCRILNTEKQGTGGKSGYSDPITELLLLTCNDFNFESSYNTLHLCPALIDQDYFLSSHKQLFLDGAKMLIFETYCRIHKAIQIDTLAKHCDWQEELKEEKLVDAVKLARVDARIDMKKQQLIVATPYPTVYQQLIDKTKSFVYRSSQLTQSIDKRIAQIKSEQRDQIKERSD